MGVSVSAVVVVVYVYVWFGSPTRYYPPLTSAQNLLPRLRFKGGNKRGIQI